MDQDLTKLTSMHLHEDMRLPANMTVTRVPGGWIYIISFEGSYPDSQTTYKEHWTSTFVPEPTEEINTIQDFGRAMLHKNTIISALEDQIKDLEEKLEKSGISIQELIRQTEGS